MPTPSPAQQPERARGPARGALPFAYAGRPTPIGGDPMIVEARARAHARYEELGLPSTRVEAWKYTNLQSLAKLELMPAERLPAIDLERIGHLLPKELRAFRIVFGNGRWRSDLAHLDDLPAGCRIVPLREATGRAAKIVSGSLDRAANGLSSINALNAAYAEDGAIIHLDPGTRLDAPLHLVFVCQGTEPAPAIHPRVVLVAEAGSALTLIESHIGQGEGAYWTTPVIDLLVGPEAQLRHVKFQDEGPSAIHLGFSEALIDRNAFYEHLLISVGGRLVRNELRAKLTAEGGAVTLNGAFLGRGRQHVDNTTDIVHAAPRCRSREVYKGALDHQARGVFQGRIVVEPGAQQTDGHQLTRTILLSDSAEIDAKPMLEIYADDVKCSHGATAGALDPDWVHYLRARGIGEVEARRLLVEGFLGEVIDGVGLPALAQHYRARVARWLGGEEEGA
ncbi:MAG TPA: Fe-S cluster assembly protein SufD [Alphaproteobacteria bacterium]|nr:Fe-S cluster assembly protein SufD [Alphaproteobacteria bacterium]